MASVRLDTPDNPDRQAKFSEVIRLRGGNPSAVLRELVDAYARFVEKHERLPVFPLEIRERETNK